MKKVLLGIAILFSVSAGAQTYKDSVITLQLTQRFANYVGQYARQLTGDDIWRNRNYLDVLKPYIGSGAANKQDSLFTVNIQVHFVTGALNMLINQKSIKTSGDMNSIIFNSPSIVGYTSLASQLTTISNGNSSQKLTAKYILDWYNEVSGVLTGERNSDYQATVQWSKY